MAHIIAVAGKGGVGKTTLSGMLIQSMCKMGKRPILAVDADANSNLNEVLGVEVEMTLGDVREEIARAENSLNNPIPASMSKADYAEIMFQRCLIEDNEAGMEHISRGILPKVDTIILVSDCSRRGVQAAGRIAELTRECDMKPKTMGLIVNRAPGGKLNQGTMEEIEKQGLTLLGVVPHDDQVYEYDCDGKPTVNLPDDSPVRVALNEIIKKLAL